MTDTNTAADVLKKYLIIFVQVLPWFSDQGTPFKSFVMEILATSHGG